MLAKMIRKILEFQYVIAAKIVDEPMYKRRAPSAKGGAYKDNEKRDYVHSLNPTNFDDDTPVFQIGNHSQILWRDWYTGTFICGATGSGKTSGPLCTFSRGLLESGIGAVILTSKPHEEREFWTRLCKIAGREDDLIIFDKDNMPRYNFLRDEQKRGATVSTIREVLLDLLRGNSNVKETDMNQRFWVLEMQKLLDGLISLCLLAETPMTMDLLKELVISAPKNKDITEEDLSGTLLAMLSSIIDNEEETLAKADDILKSYYDNLSNFWLEEWPNADQKVRANITSDFTGTMHEFAVGECKLAFCSEEENNFTPDDVIDRHKIILIDFPTQEYKKTGQTLQRVMRQLICRRAFQRKTITTPYLEVIDEAQNHFAGKYDAMAQALKRSYKVISIFATQNLGMFSTEGVPKELIRAFIGNLKLHIYCQNADPDTNQFASDVFGAEIVQVHSSSANLGSGRPNEPQGGSSITTSEAERRKVQPIEFTRLQDGGNANNLRVGAIVNKAGKTFEETGENYLKTVFRQDPKMKI